MELKLRIRLNLQKLKVLKIYGNSRKLICSFRIPQNSLWHFITKQLANKEADIRICHIYEFKNI